MLLSASCEDFLTKVPETDLSPDTFFTTEAEISSSPTLSSVPVAYLLKSRAKLLIVVPSFVSEIVLFLPVASLMIGSSALKLPVPAYRYANR